MTTPTIPAEADPAGPPALDFTGPSSRRRVFAWGMWDWGTQPFNTVITTFVFSVYITSESFGATNATSTALAISTAISGLFVALLAPVLGQNSDRSGRTVRNLRFQTWLLAGLSASLYVVQPEPAYLWVGLVLLGVGSVVSEIAGVNYNATIDQVATGEDGGAGLGLRLGDGVPRRHPRPARPVLPAHPARRRASSASRTPTAWTSASRCCCAGCGRSSSPSRRSSCCATGPGRRAPRVGVVMSYRLVWRSIRGLWATSRHTVYFLLASALFRDGLAGVFAFGAILAHGTFGLSAGDVIVFGAAANIVAGFATMAFGLLDDRIGPKRVILISLGSLVVLGVLIFVLHDGGPSTFWVLGLLMTVFVGPAQAASRSFLARLIPEGKNGEIFGLYATTGRVVSFMSPVAFGAFIAIGAAVTGQENTQYWGILGIVLILAAGFAVMLPVKEHGEHRIG